MENNGEGSDDGWVWTSLILMVGILSLGFKVRDEGLGLGLGLRFRFRLRVYF